MKRPGARYSTGGRIPTHIGEPDQDVCAEREGISKRQ